MRSAECVAGRVAYHGEGPFWDATTGRLLIMDVLTGAIVALDPSGGRTRYQLSSRVVTVIRRRTCGGFVVATEHGLVGTDDEFSILERIADVTDDPNIRANDGGCDMLGGFVIGTMPYDGRAGTGAVYRVTPEHEVKRILSSVSISNGVQWTSDGAHVYYIDTPTRRVDLFDVDSRTGDWSRRREHIRLDDALGYPDGMAIDEDGGLWIALWGGGAVNHYDSEGQLIETVAVPGVTQVSSCGFGGVERDVLYITTSRQGLAEGEEPSAGSVFAVPTNSRGAILPEFAG